MKTVLVIDDSAAIRLYLRYVLEKSNYFVYEANNGKVGYDLYKKVRPDYVITDIFMPEMDGIETIQKLFSEFPEIKIMAMSDGGKFGKIPYFEICKRYGVVNCLCKPINKDSLLNCLSSL